MGRCVKFCTVTVACLAVFVGLIYSGFIAEHTNFFPWLDQLYTFNGKVMMGLTPAFHKNTPWGYTFDQLEKNDLSGKVIVVTGGNQGLGFWTAQHLAARNADVVISCRSKEKCRDAAKQIKEATGKEVSQLQCDLSSFKSVKAFAKALRQEVSKVDSLILNAGVCEVPYGLTEDGLEMHIGINHFGHFLMTRELLPLLEQAAAESGAATVVVLSSATHFFSHPEGILGSIEEMNSPQGYDAGTGYAHSKLANVLFAQELAERMKSKNVLVNSCHPGLVATSMMLNSASRSFGNGSRGVMSSFTWHPRDAAMTQIYLAVGEEITSKKITGQYFHPIARQNMPHAHARNSTLQAHLWTLTENFLESKLKFNHITGFKFLKDLIRS